MNEKIENIEVPNFIEVNVQWGSIIDSIVENIDIINKEFIFKTQGVNSINLCNKIIDDFFENMQNSKAVISSEILTKNQKKYSNQFCNLVYNVNKVVEDDKQGNTDGQSRQ